MSGVCRAAMGYVAFTASPDNCGSCARSQEQPWPKPIGRVCQVGGFYVEREGTCSLFEQEPVPLIPIGPLDV